MLLVGSWIVWRERGSLQPASATLSDGPSRLVVLPFENLSRQPGDEWLASAFSDSLTLGLRDSENLIVVSRERLLELNRGSDPDVDLSNTQQVSRILGVRYYVTRILSTRG